MLKKIWLQLSGFGIMFAVLSWLQEASILSKELGGIKGLIAVVIGLGLMNFWITAVVGFPIAVVAITLLILTLMISLLIRWIGPTIGFIFDNSPKPFPTFYKAPINIFNRLAKKDDSGNCFSKNTMINTIDKSLPIQNIQPGDILDNNSLVTCTMILDSSNEDFYILDKFL